VGEKLLEKHKTSHTTLGTTMGSALEYSTIINDARLVAGLGTVETNSLMGTTRPANSAGGPAIFQIPAGRQTELL
jgi:hypothetical protein